jgi:hypothetical protein
VSSGKREILFLIRFLIEIIMGPELRNKKSSPDNFIITKKTIYADEK